MKHLLLLLAAVCLATTGCKKKAPPENSSTSKPGENPVTAPLDYVGAVGKTHQTAQKSTGLITINEAIKMFQEEEGRLPKDLNELVSKGTLPKLPDPPNGMKFEFDATTGKAKVSPK